MIFNLRGSRLAWFGLLLFAGQALAQDGALPPAYVPPETQAYAPSPTLLLFRTLGSLALVVGLIFVCGWLLKLRGGGAAAGGGGRLKVIESSTLGPNRTIHLVAVGGKVLLLGGADQVSCLASFTPDEVDWNPDTEAASFESLLQRLPWAPHETPAAGD